MLGRCDICGRFKPLVEAVIQDPAALAAAIGRKKYGAKKFAQMAAKGRKGGGDGSRFKKLTRSLAQKGKKSGEGEAGTSAGAKKGWLSRARSSKISVGPHANFRPGETFIQRPGAPVQMKNNKGQIMTQDARGVFRASDARVHKQSGEAEVSPPGWSGTVRAMGKHKDITNPYALSYWMKNRGDKPHHAPVRGKAIRGAESVRLFSRYLESLAVARALARAREQVRRELRA